MSIPKPSKPEYGRVLAARRAYLGKSAMVIENETGGLIYQKLMYRIEAGKPHPLELDVRTFDALLSVLEWTPEEFSKETDIVLPYVIRRYVESKPKADEDLERAAVGLDLYTFPTYNAGTGPAWDMAEAEMITLSLPKTKLQGLDPNKIFGLWARGESMSTYIKNGDLAVCYRDPGRVTAGDAAAIWFSDDGVCVKYFLGEEGGELILGNANPDYDRVFRPPLGSRIQGVVIFTINF